MRTAALCFLATLALAFEEGVAAQSAPTFSIEPASTAVSTDAPAFQVRLLIDDVTNVQGLGGYTLLMDYNPAAVRALTVEDSGYVGSTGNASLCPSSAIEHETGRLGLFCFTIPVFSGPGPRTDEPQVLAVISFEAVAPGSTVLDISDSTAIDPQGNGLGATTANGSVTVEGRPGHGPLPAASPADGTASERDAEEPSEADTQLPAAGAGGGRAVHSNRAVGAVLLAASAALWLSAGALIRREMGSRSRQPRR
jgi:hypothetical protein